MNLDSLLAKVENPIKKKYEPPMFMFISLMVCIIGFLGYVYFHDVIYLIIVGCSVLMAMASYIMKLKTKEVE